VNPTGSQISDLRFQKVKGAGNRSGTPAGICEAEADLSQSKIGIGKSQII